MGCEGVGGLDPPLHPLDPPLLYTSHKYTQIVLSVCTSFTASTDIYIVLLYVS